MRASRRAIVAAPLAVFICGLLTCVHSSHDVSKPSPSDGKIVFQVRAGCGGTMLQGVKVSVVSLHKGIVPLGETDVFGALSATKTDLQALDAVVILFCHDWYVCGSLRVDEPAFYDYREHYLQLAPVAFP